MSVIAVLVIVLFFLMFLRFAWVGMCVSTVVSSVVVVVRVTSDRINGRRRLFTKLMTDFVLVCHR